MSELPLGEGYSVARQPHNGALRRSVGAAGREHKGVLHHRDLHYIIPVLARRWRNDRHPVHHLPGIIESNVADILEGEIGYMPTLYREQQFITIDSITVNGKNTKGTVFTRREGVALVSPAVARGAVYHLVRSVLVAENLQHKLTVDICLRLAAIGKAGRYRHIERHIPTVHIECNVQELVSL